MTKDEALRLALEALEKLWNIIDDIDTYSDMAKADEKLYRSLVERRQRQRFEETGISTDGYELHGGAITAIKAALEAKNEPVAWAMLHDNGHFIDAIHPNEHARVEGEYITPLYTIPPQRTWVGLTDDDEIDWEEGGNLKDLVKAIETKLKDKNR
jgi:hypothetical protein